MVATHELLSIGYCCQLLQQTPAAISKVAESLKIKPALRLNGVTHFDDEQFAAIRDHFAAAKAKQTKRNS